MAAEYSCCDTDFFIRIIVIIVLVLFAGLMSGLTLGLMSLSLVDLEVLAKSGKPTDRLHAGTFFNGSLPLFLPILPNLKAFPSCMFYFHLGCYIINLITLLCDPWLLISHMPNGL